MAWLYTQSWIQQKQPVEFDGLGTRGCMLCSLGYTVGYWIYQNQAKYRSRILDLAGQYSWSMNYQSCIPYLNNFSSKCNILFLTKPCSSLFLFSQSNHRWDRWRYRQRLGPFQCQSRTAQPSRTLTVSTHQRRPPFQIIQIASPSSQDVFKLALSQLP